MLKKQTGNFSESGEEDSELSIINDEESLDSESLSEECSLESLDVEEDNFSHGEDEVQLLNELKQVSKALPTIHSVNESYICSQNNLSQVTASKQQQPSQTSQDFDQYYYRCVENFLKNKKEKLEKKRKEIEETEMSEAKHKPNLIAKQQNKEHVPLVERIKKIKLKKEHQIMKAKKEQEQKLEQEISQYTFKPKTNKRPAKKPQRDLSPLETTSAQKTNTDDKNVFQPQIDKKSSKIAKKVIENTSTDVVERLYVHAQDNQNKKKEQLLKQYLPDFKPKLYKSNHKWAKSIDHEKSKLSSETKLNIDNPQKEGSSTPSNPGSQNNIPEDSTCSSSDQMPCPAALHKLMQIMSSYSNSNQDHNQNHENTTSSTVETSSQKKNSEVIVVEQEAIPQINLFARTPKAISPQTSVVEEKDPSLQEIDSFKQNLEDMQKNLLALKASFKNFQNQKSPMKKQATNKTPVKKARPSRSPQSSQAKKRGPTSENSKSPANRSAKKSAEKQNKNLVSRDTNLESAVASSPFKSECSSINFEPQSLETTTLVQQNPESAVVPKEQTFRPSQPSLNFESTPQKQIKPQLMTKFNITRNEYIYNDSKRILHQTKPNDIATSAQNLRDIALMTLRKFRNYDH